MSASLYNVRYVKKKNIHNGKFDPSRLEEFVIPASNATRAISATKRSLVESGDIEKEGDIKIIASSPVVAPQYIVTAVGKNKVESGKFDPKDTKEYKVRATDATRAITTVKKENNDIVVLDVRPEF